MERSFYEFPQIAAMVNVEQNRSKVELDLETM